MLHSILKLELKDTRTEEIFLELLKEKYSNKICEVADAFLNSPAKNMIAPFLFANADQNLPVKYANLLF